MQDISYILGNSLYLNITNRCTNACTFCIRYKPVKFHGEFNLWLDHEPDVAEIMKEVGDPKQYDQIVFCGYGEPLIRLDTAKEVSLKLKSEFRNPKSEQGIKIRIDTNGQANLFYGRNILPELKDLVDVMSISLNAEKSETYDSLCNSFYGSKAFGAVIDFAKEAKKVIPEVELSVVDVPNIDKDKAKKIADDIGVKFRVRPYYEEKYVP